MDYQKMWQSITDCWQVKMVCSGVVTGVTFLLGDVMAAPFMALWVLVALDTFTRWAAIGRKTLSDNKMSGSVWDGIWLASRCKTSSPNVSRNRRWRKYISP